nr:immunoglobulin light chain junction region [Macaca mulatta]MOV65880.1 immunoglobulin light chain junction region [Macaca mulatta]MOV66032.1 immunoglobulin light chain junction region [Macaca mulatta]MOV66133.1 immunoglobulin light chain junction region [Macaca mulatta]MOV66156.1 immunoglobulin light chain junction region [Macaca mulatta]
DYYCQSYDSSLIAVLF